MSSRLESDIGSLKATTYSSIGYPELIVESPSEVGDVRPFIENSLLEITQRVTKETQSVTFSNLGVSAVSLLEAQAPTLIDTYSELIDYVFDSYAKSHSQVKSLAHVQAVRDFDSESAVLGLQAGLTNTFLMRSGHMATMAIYPFNGVTSSLTNCAPKVLAPLFESANSNLLTRTVSSTSTVNFVEQAINWGFGVTYDFFFSAFKKRNLINTILFESLSIPSLFDTIQTLRVSCKFGGIPSISLSTIADTRKSELEQFNLVLNTLAPTSLNGNLSFIYRTYETTPIPQPTLTTCYADLFSNVTDTGNICNSIPMFSITRSDSSLKYAIVNREYASSLLILLARGFTGSSAIPNSSLAEVLFTSQKSLNTKSDLFMSFLQLLGQVGYDSVWLKLASKSIHTLTDSRTILAILGTSFIDSKNSD